LFSGRAKSIFDYRFGKKEVGDPKAWVTGRMRGRKGRSEGTALSARAERTEIKFIEGKNSPGAGACQEHRAGRQEADEPADETQADQGAKQDAPAPVKKEEKPAEEEAKRNRTVMDAASARLMDSFERAEEI